MKGRAKRTTLGWALTALVVSLPALVSACGDDGTEPSEGGTNGGSGAGGTHDEGGMGGASASGTDAGRGGNDGGTAGDPATGGSSGTSDGGGANEVGGGATGGGPPVSDCDLSGEEKPLVVLPNEIESDLLLDDANDYFMNGFVVVRPGATLTISACTRLEGSPLPTPGYLVVERGAKLVALGTKDDPILFTTASKAGRAAGMWGGVHLFGGAPITRPSGQRENSYRALGDRTFTYGAAEPDPSDDSGTLRYVRIEFGGGARSIGGSDVPPAKGLTMAGVGSGTTIDHVMVSNVTDDCFEWLGGTVTADYLVANNCGDDYFSGSEGWQGGGRYWFGRRANFAIDSLDPSGLEMATTLDNSTPATHFSISKLTLCGTAQDSLTAQHSHGVLLRDLAPMTQTTRAATGSIDDMALAGFDHAIDTQGDYRSGDVTIQNSTFWDLIFELDNNANEGSAADDDHAFVDGSVITDEPTNEFDPDPKPFWADDCVAIEGPTPDVLESNLGAFEDGADWMGGTWIDWAEQ
jgi:hypothetical protein